MSVIAVYNAKGGVGKTTIAANLASCSSSQGEQSTLLWDFDAAGGAGFLFGVELNSKQVSAIISRDGDPARLLWESGYPNLDLLPADESVGRLDALLAQMGNRRRLEKLMRRLRKDYARIILDCPAGVNDLTGQILREAEIVIVPLPPSPLSSRAFERVAAEVKRVGVKAPSILPIYSMVDARRKLHRMALEAEPKWPVIPYASVVEQCAVRQQPVGAFAPSSPAAKRFDSLWHAIEQKLEERGA